jgi:hypothetical protein
MIESQVYSVGLAIFLSAVKHFSTDFKFIISEFYLKKESTNSSLLNTCKSFIPSPTPIYFTGI